MTSKSDTHSSRGVQLRIHTRYQGHQVWASVGLVGESTLAHGSHVDLGLYHYYQAKIIEQHRIKRLLPGFSQEVAFTLDDAPSGTCWFVATLTDRYGQTAPVRVIQETPPPQTDWLGSKSGITRRVPRPWPVLKTTKDHDKHKVSCWNRTYQFDAKSLIQQMMSSNHKLLRGPIVISAKVNGRPVRLSKRLLCKREASDDRVVFDTQGATRDLTVQWRSETEYDGMVRFDWELIARKPIRIDQLTLDIPLDASTAKYICEFPGAWSSSKNARQLPRSRQRMGFRPFIWLGDEQHGLACFFESDEHWFNKHPDQAVEIFRQNDTVIWRYHLVTKPVELQPDASPSQAHTGAGTQVTTDLTDRLRYTFGLQVTPVKPSEKKTDAWQTRTVCLGSEMSKESVSLPLNIPHTLLDQLASAGVRTVVIFEYWTDNESHTQTTHARKLKSLVKACHDRGLKVLLYFGFLISDRAPQWRDFGHQCVKSPKSGYPVYHYLPQPVQGAWTVCLQSVWQDFLVDGIDRAMADFDLDGVYLDSTSTPFACTNTLHGCGTIKQDGSIAQSYPIFATRHTMQRIYHVVRSHKKNGLINVHNSTCMVIPALAFATSYWDGEQFSQIARQRNRTQTEDMMSVLPLDAFRAEFMGHQWGVSAEFLCYGKPFTYQESWGFCLLHDVPVRPVHLNPDLPIASKIWHLMDDFDRANAIFMPYWSNNTHVEIKTKHILASLYHHPNHGVLVIVMNMQNKKSDVSIRLIGQRLNLHSKQSAKDALTGKSINLKQGVISVKLKPFSWKIAWIQ